MPRKVPWKPPAIGAAVTEVSEVSVCARRLVRTGEVCFEKRLGCTPDHQ